MQDNNEKQPMAQIIDFPNAREATASEGEHSSAPTPDWFIERYVHEPADGEHELIIEMVNTAPAGKELGEAYFRLACIQLGWYDLLQSFKSSAENGHGNGQLAMAQLLEVGAYGEDWWLKEAGKPDLIAAAYWYDRAEAQGVSEAVGRAQVLCKQVLALAEGGDADAMFDIGACFETGLFAWIEQNADTAMNWYERAAEGGNIAAHFALGEIKLYGAYGQPKDADKAIVHLCTAWDVLARFKQSGEHHKEITMLSELRVFSSWSWIQNLCGLRSPWALNRALLLSFELCLDSLYNDTLRRTDLTEIPDDEFDDLEWETKLVLTLHQYRATSDLAAARMHLRSMLWYTDEINEVGVDSDAPDAESPLHLSLFPGVSDWGDPFGSFSGRKPEDPETMRCRRVESTLRELAQKGVEEAEFLLGLILIGSSPRHSPDFEEGRARLDAGVQRGDLLSCLWYANLAQSGKLVVPPNEMKMALARVTHADVEEMRGFRKYQKGKEIFSEEFFETLQKRAQDQLRRIEIEEAAHRAREDAERDMLSYLTHTLNNTLSSGPEAARQTMRILGSEMYENNRDYKAINNIAAMFSTFLFAQQLLKTFKLYVADPEALRKNWEDDQGGDSSVAAVLALTLRQTLSQVVFSVNQQAALQRLLPHKEAGAIKMTRKSFMETLVPLDVDSTNAQAVFGWVREHLGVILVAIDEGAEMHFKTNSTRFTFLFSAFSEIVYNALKYSDGRQPIEIAWRNEAGAHVFSCRNSWSDDSRLASEGSGKGLVFLDRLATMLGAQLQTRQEDGSFEAQLVFPEGLIAATT